MSGYPVVALRMRDGEATMKEIDDFFDELQKELMAREGNFVIKTFGSASPVSGKMRTKVGLNTQQMAQAVGHRTLATIIILESALGRIMLKGILLMVNTPIKIKVASNEAEADRMIDKYLAIEV
ncbi:MAG TPA: hypothetical protein DCE41_06610 [Cytophagales bacterium]|nr:hypothetical protein [Cytophagales bacterium]HAA21874.1 hypothetical protein [Cytophagales bacterium]HAP58258.1 hypothetical protein [Cytophagales bacterium]